MATANSTIQHGTSGPQISQIALYSIDPHQHPCGQDSMAELGRLEAADWSGQVWDIRVSGALERSDKSQTGKTG